MRTMFILNEVIGVLLLVFGLFVEGICLFAYLKVLSKRRDVKRGLRGPIKWLDGINAVIRSFTGWLKLIPTKYRHIFALLPFGLIFIIIGLYVLIKKPI